MRVPTGLHPTSCNPLPVFLFVMHHAISAIPSNVMHPTLFFCSSCVMLSLRFHSTSCNPFCFSVRHAISVFPSNVLQPIPCFSVRHATSAIPSKVMQPIPCFSVRHAISVIPSNVLQPTPCFSVRRASCYLSDVFFHNLP